MESVDLDRGSELVVDLEALTVTTPAGKVLPVRVRRVDPLPAPQRPRRHRHHAPARGRDHGLRGRRGATARMTHVAVLPGRRDRARGRGRGDAGARRARDRPFGARVRRQRDPRPGRPAPGRDARRLPRGRRRPARRRRAARARGPGRSAGAGAARAPQGARRLREPAPGACSRDRHDDRARARRRPLLRRQGHARRRHLVRHLRVLAAGGRADRPARLRDRGGARRPPDVGRQGERHAHLAALARRRLGARREQLSRRAARSRARRLVRDDDRAGAGDDRHGRDREHVRRHPLRRRRGRDRRARARRLGLARRRRARGSSSRSTARRRRSRARGSRTRRRCCGRSRCSSPMGSAASTRRPRSSRRSTPRSPRLRRPTSAARARRATSAMPSCAPSTLPVPCDDDATRACHDALPPRLRAPCSASPLWASRRLRPCLAPSS